MPQKNKNIQKRYEGFLQTPSLWKESLLYSLKPFLIPTKFTKFTVEIDENQRLGKYIERLVSFELQQQENIQILAENIQIQRDKITLGELDCLLIRDKKTIHVEIVYKFYVYDTSVGTSEIDHFIGPNRKDSLLEKLKKLSQKQLPLLHSVDAKKHLQTLVISSENCSQQIYFKAQLFLPYPSTIQLKIVNPDCIAGFYIQQKQLHVFENCKFFIPNKIDWLVIPHQQVPWLCFDEFTKKSKDYLARNFSPLCWMKSKNGELKKFFLVWW